MFLRASSGQELAVRRDVTFLRSVMAVLMAVLVMLVAVQPAVAASRRDRQWHLDYLDIEAVHRISTGQGVVVAVVDSGVDATHPDLKGQVLPGLRSDGRSGDGRVDEDGHGTHVAAIIAGTNSGRDGVLGVAPGAKILPIRVSKNDISLLRYRSVPWVSASLPIRVRRSSTSQSLGPCPVSSSRRLSMRWLRML